MREAIGGSWLLGFVIVFVVLFSGYLAISINYTKAFKVKNQILNIIEQNEGFTQSNDQKLETLSENELLNNEDAESQIIASLKGMGYYTNDTLSCDEEKQGESQLGGYCLKHICTPKGNYYRVTTFIRIEIPIISISVKVPIRGETPIIYYDNAEC